MSAARGTSKLVTTAAAVAALAGAGARAQESVASYHVQGNVHLLLAAGANVAVQIGACRTSPFAGSSTPAPIETTPAATRRSRRPA
jgi:hypothetical protein